MQRKRLETADLDMIRFSGCRSTAKTSAELTMEEKNRISHRGKALERMKDALKEALGE